MRRNIPFDINIKLTLAFRVVPLRRHGGGMRLLHDQGAHGMYGMLLQTLIAAVHRVYGPGVRF